MTDTPSLTAPRGVLTANLICMASMLTWAVGLAAADLLTPLLPPMPLGAARITLAMLAILPIWWLVEGFGPFRRTPWGAAFLVGGIGLGVGGLLLVYAQARTDAVTVAVISASTPIIGLALECVFDGRRLTWSMLVGLVLGVAGGLLALDWSRGGVALGAGALAAFGAALCFTSASRATVTKMPGMSALGRTAATVTGGALVTLVFVMAGAAFGMPMGDWSALGWREYAALAAFGIGAMAISQVLWITAVARLGIGIASLHMNTASFYVMLVVFVAGGLWDWQRAMGAAVVVLGVLVAQGMIRVPRWKA